MLLFVAHDPGGMNVILPVVRYYVALQQKDAPRLRLMFAGAARERAIKEGLSKFLIEIPVSPILGFPNEFETTDSDVLGVFEEVNPTVVITATSYNSNIEWLAWKIAEMRGIPSVALFDYWGAYKERFEKNGAYVVPYHMVVTDEYMANSLHSYLGHIAPERIVIAGNTNLEYLALKIQTGREYSQRTKEHGVQAIRFFSENNWHYFPEGPINEFRLVEEMLTILHKEKTPIKRYIVRPHPMENRQEWEDFCKVVSLRFSDIQCEVDTQSFDEVLQDSSSIAVGITSMALIELSVCGIPTFSYQVKIPKEAIPKAPLSEYGISVLSTIEDFITMCCMQRSGPVALSLYLQHHSPLSTIITHINQISSTTFI